MDLEYKSIGAKNVIGNIDEENGILTAIVSVTGIEDNVKDIIEVGAYEKSMKKRTPKGVWSHQWAVPVSRTLEMKELLPGDEELPKQLANGDPWPKEAGAIQVKTQFNLDTEQGRTAFSNVVFYGDEQEWSVGYQVPEGKAYRDSKGVRHIKELNWYEYSPVLFGAMSNARSVKELAHEQLVSVKSLLGDDNFREEVNEVMGIQDSDVEKKSGLPEGSIEELIEMQNRIDEILVKALGSKKETWDWDYEDDEDDLEDEEDDWDEEEEAPAPKSKKKRKPFPRKKPTPKELDDEDMDDWEDDEEEDSREEKSLNQNPVMSLEDSLFALECKGYNIHDVKLAIENMDYEALQKNAAGVVENGEAAMDMIEQSVVEERNWSPELVQIAHALNVRAQEYLDALDADSDAALAHREGDEDSMFDDSYDWEELHPSTVTPTEGISPVIVDLNGWDEDDEDGEDFEEDGAGKKTIQLTTAEYKSMIQGI